MPVGIANCILQCKPDISKQESYAIDFEDDSFENVLHHAFDAAGPNDLDCLSGCLYTDIDNAQKHTNSKLVLALANHKDFETTINPVLEVPVLIY